MGPKFRDKCQTQRRRPCKDGSGDWSEVATSQGMSGATRGGRNKAGFYFRALGGGEAH